MVIIAQHEVREVEKIVRLSDYAIGLFEQLPSRKSVKKAINSGVLLVNGKAAETGRIVNIGDEIILQDLPRVRRTEYPLNLPIIYEDDDLAVIHKPSGIPVSGNTYRNVDNALPYNLNMPKINQANVLPVHRLDVATSGLLLIGKNRKAVIFLGQQFATGQVSKTYHALSHGHCAASGKICLAIDHKKSETVFRRLEYAASPQGGGMSLLEVQPKTGRTHQIRKHLAAMGHPIVGDKLYNEAGKTYVGKGLFLAATRIAFKHPRDQGKMDFSIPIPPKFSAMLKYQAKRMENLNKTKD